MSNFYANNKKDHASALIDTLTIYRRNKKKEDKADYIDGLIYKKGC